MSEVNFDPVNLTQSLVKCASVTPKDEGALTVVENHLKAIGCDCHSLTFSGNNSYEVKNLFATIGNEGKHFAYAGHTDVVPVGNESSWKYPPFSGKIDGAKLYGRGSEDMKSSVACFISAAKRFVDRYKDFSGKRNTVFKFNDLKSNVSFLAFRVEGDKISIEEKINNLKKELKLNNSDISTLDVYQSEPFWEKINNLEVFEKTKHNLIRMVIPPANGSKLCKYLENNHNYFVDWCGSLFWIEVNSKKEEKIKDLKKMANDFGGYLTVIKTSSEYDYGEPIFTVDKVRLMISEKVKQSFDPKRILNPGKMYRGV